VWGTIAGKIQKKLKDVKKFSLPVIRFTSLPVEENAKNK